MIQAWVRLWDHREHPRCLALIRICVGLALLVDFLRIAQLDLVLPLFAPTELGGISNVSERPRIPEIYALLPATTATARAAHALVCVTGLTFALGLFTRLSGLLLLLTSAQLALVVPLGDRGIDLILRNVILILLFSGSHRCWSIDAWRKTGSFQGDGEELPAWPRHLLVLQLVVMYAMAGVQKTSLDWWPWGHYSALFVILHDPAIALWDMRTLLNQLYPLTQIGSLLTMVFELTAPLVLLVFYYRGSQDRPGRLRAWVCRHNPHFWWLGAGVVLHIMIAGTMALGIFPWAMLGLYPAFLHPEELAALGRRLRLAPSQA